MRRSNWVFLALRWSPLLFFSKHTLILGRHITPVPLVAMFIIRPHVWLCTPYWSSSRSLSLHLILLWTHDYRKRDSNVGLGRVHLDTVGRRNIQLDWLSTIEGLLLSRWHINLLLKLYIGCIHLWQILGSRRIIKLPTIGRSSWCFASVFPPRGRTWVYFLH